MHRQVSSTGRTQRNARADLLPKNIRDRAWLLDKAADSELSLGHHAIAERLSRTAAELREAHP